MDFSLNELGIILAIIVVIYYWYEAVNPKEEKHSGKPMVYSSFLARCCAFIIDVLIIMGLFSLLQVLLFHEITFYYFPEFRKLILSGNWVKMTWSCLIVILGLYCVIFESSRVQATIGKKAMNIKVTNLMGKRINFLHAIGRYLLKFLSFLSFGFGIWAMILDLKKQTFHDKLGSTLVLKDNNKKE